MNTHSKLLMGWIIIVLILTWIPGNALPKPELFDINIIEISVHFGMFMVFSYLLASSIYKIKNLDIHEIKLIVIVISISIIFSFITEVGQFFIPGRHFHILDLLINLMGSLFGIGLFFIKLKYFSNKRI